MRFSTCLRNAAIPSVCPTQEPSGGGLFELRFQLGDRNQRVTYVFEPVNRIITLTTFRKQRQVEQKQIGRARRAADNYRKGQ